jgi:MFS family permease
MHKRGMLAVLLMAPFMAQADVTIANVAAPSIHARLGASGAQLELVVGGYLVAFASLLITGARLGQTHGHRRVFVLGVAGFTTGSLLCGLAPTPDMLIAARVIQGAGAALMFPQALTGIRLNFDGPERARAIGLYAIALSAGAVAGQVLGGALVSADVAGAHWRSIFFVNVPIGVAVSAAAVRLLPIDRQTASREVDLVGVATLAAGVLLIVLPLALGRAEGWPLWTWLCLAASVPVLTRFVATQRRMASSGRSPLLNLQAFTRPTISWGLGAVAAATATYYALLFTLALYLQQGLADSPLASGLTLVSFVAAFGLAGQLVRRLPPELQQLAAPAGCLLLAGAYCTISVTLFAGLRSEALLVSLLGAGGLGLGIQYSAIIAHLTGSVPAHYAPDISGVTTTAMQVAGAVAVAAFGTVYLGLASPAGAAHATHAFAVVTAALATMAFVAAGGAHRATGPSPRLSVRRSAS